MNQPQEVADKMFKHFRLIWGDQFIEKPRIEELPDIHSEEAQKIMLNYIVAYIDHQAEVFESLLPLFVAIKHHLMVNCLGNIRTFVKLINNDERTSDMVYQAFQSMHFRHFDQPDKFSLPEPEENETV